MDLFGKKAAAENQQLKEKVYQLTNQLQFAQEQLNALGYPEIVKAKIEIQKQQEEIKANQRTIQTLNFQISEAQTKYNELLEKDNKLTKQIQAATRKVSRVKELYNSVEYSINKFFACEPNLEHCKLELSDSSLLNEISPTVMLNLHAMDMRDLRKAYKENDKQVSKLLEQYASRYTTKSNKAIYELMVIALRAELQNILYSLKYEKLDSAIEQVKDITAKYLAIAGAGNQNIVGTLTKFIGEIEYLFINAVKIEYNYYVKKEQAKQEQAAIREQMRQEAAERKALEAERKKVEAEENKYKQELARLQELLSTTDDGQKEVVEGRILEVQSMLADVTVKKADIINLQNGKAGNIYIISNLGSFGENVFKIGMTRRSDPQDRVNELGDASVPFQFDVHSFIFSQDAVSLEASLHEVLNDKRVNKVNLRKEFFRVTIDELEELVYKIAPTAEFSRTMLAEEFRQSESSDENYTSDFVYDEDEE